MRKKGKPYLYDNRLFSAFLFGHTAERPTI